MNWIDITILIGTSYLVLRGLWVGFIKGVFRYLSIAAGILISLWFYPVGVRLLKTAADLPEAWLNAISLVALFLATVCAVQLTGVLISRLIRPTPLGPVDRVLGGGLGGFKAAAICTLAAVLLTAIPLPERAAKKCEESLILKQLLVLAPRIKSWAGGQMELKNAVNLRQYLNAEFPKDRLP